MTLHKQGDSLELYFRFGTAAISNTEIKHFANLKKIQSQIDVLNEDFRSMRLFNNYIPF